MAAHHFVRVDVSSNYSSLNALLHKYQEYGHTPVCTHWCLTR